MPNIIERFKERLGLQVRANATTSNNLTVQKIRVLARSVKPYLKKEGLKGMHNKNCDLLDRILTAIDAMIKIATKNGAHAVAAEYRELYDGIYNEAERKRVCMSVIRSHP